MNSTELSEDLRLALQNLDQSLQGYSSFNWHLVR